MIITGTHFSYYQVCRRKLWLFANGITFEHTSDLVYEGRLIHENSYPQRPGKYEEVEVDGIKVDFYDVRNKIVHEIKKSDKMEKAHEWQLKYYIHVFERNGIDGVQGLLEYPKLRKTAQVALCDVDRRMIATMEDDIRQISDGPCPEIKMHEVCRNCSYFDFCFSNEPEAR